MLLDAAAAKALFAIVLTSTQGVDALRPQLPLHVVDRGDSWLVTGAPYTDPSAGMRGFACAMPSSPSARPRSPASAATRA